LEFWHKFKTVLLPDILESFAIAMAISVSIYYTLLIPNIVDGASMEPNFHNHELLVTNRVVQWLGSTELGKNMNLDYHRGDIVIFHTGKIDLIKRVVGLPGESIKIEDGNVYIDEKQLREDYLPSTKTFLPYRLDASLEEGETLTLGEGQYFLMGDNRNNSKDSRFREVGAVHRSQFKGRVILRYWPIEQFTFYGWS
jgi:signal peptidase I